MTLDEAKDLFFTTLGNVNPKDVGTLFEDYKKLEIPTDIEDDWRNELANLLIDDLSRSKAEVIRKNVYGMLELVVLEHHELYNLFIDYIFERVFKHYDYNIDYLTSILYFNPEQVHLCKTTLFDYIYNDEYIDKLNKIVKAFKENEKEIAALEKYRYEDLMERYESLVTKK